MKKRMTVQFIDNIKRGIVRDANRAAPAHDLVGTRTPACAGCGHLQGDHRSTPRPVAFPVRYGVCLVAGCSCREYIEEAT